MLKINLKFHFKLVVVVVLTLGVSISMQSILAQWQAPTAGPPVDNIKTPINTGLATQGKLGSFNVGGDIGVGRDLVIDGRFALNDATSSYNILRIGVI